MIRLGSNWSDKYGVVVILHNTELHEIIYENLSLLLLRLAYRIFKRYPYTHTTSTIG